MIHLTLQSSNVCVATLSGRFISVEADAPADLVIARGDSVELYTYNSASNKYVLANKTALFSTVRSVLKIPSVEGKGTGRDFLVVGSDSGYLTVSGFNVSLSEWHVVASIGYGFPGCLRDTPGQFLALHTRSEVQAIMCSSVEGDANRVVCVFDQPENDSMDAEGGGDTYRRTQWKGYSLTVVPLEKPSGNGEECVEDCVVFGSAGWRDGYAVLEGILNASSLTVEKRVSFYSLSRPLDQTKSQGQGSIGSFFLTLDSRVSVPNTSATLATSGLDGSVLVGGLGSVGSVTTAGYQELVSVPEAGLCLSMAPATSGGETVVAGFEGGLLHGKQLVVHGSCASVTLLSESLVLTSDDHGRLCCHALSPGGKRADKGPVPSFQDKSLAGGDAPILDFAVCDLLQNGTAQIVGCSGASIETEVMGETKKNPYVFTLQAGVRTDELASLDITKLLSASMDDSNRSQQIASLTSRHGRASVLTCGGVWSLSDTAVVSSDHDTSTYEYGNQTIVMGIDQHSQEVSVLPTYQQLASKIEADEPVPHRFLTQVRTLAVGRLIDGHSYLQCTPKYLLHISYDKGSSPDSSIATMDTWQPPDKLASIEHAVISQRGDQVLIGVAGGSTGGELFYFEKEKDTATGEYGQLMHRALNGDTDKGFSVDNRDICCLDLAPPCPVPGYAHLVFCAVGCRDDTVTLLSLDEASLFETCCSVTLSGKPTSLCLQWVTSSAPSIGVGSDGYDLILHIAIEQPAPAPAQQGQGHTIGGQRSSRSGLLRSRVLIKSIAPGSAPKLQLETVSKRGLGETPVHLTRLPLSADPSLQPEAVVANCDTLLLLHSDRTGAKLSGGSPLTTALPLPFQHTGTGIGSGTGVDALCACTLKLGEGAAQEREREMQVLAMACAVGRGPQTRVSLRLVAVHTSSLLPPSPDACTLLAEPRKAFAVYSRTPVKYVPRRVQPLHQVLRDLPSRSVLFSQCLVMEAQRLSGPDEARESWGSALEVVDVVNRTVLHSVLLEGDVRALSMAVVPHVGTKSGGKGDYYVCVSVLVDGSRAQLRSYVFSEVEGALLAHKHTLDLAEPALAVVAVASLSQGDIASLLIGGGRSLKLLDLQLDGGTMQPRAEFPVISKGEAFRHNSVCKLSVDEDTRRVFVGTTTNSLIVCKLVGGMESSGGAISLRVLLNDGNQPRFLSALSPPVASGSKVAAGDRFGNVYYFSIPEDCEREADIAAFLERKDSGNGEDAFVDFASSDADELGRLGVTVVDMVPTTRRKYKLMESFTGKMGALVESGEGFSSSSSSAATAQAATSTNNTAGQQLSVVLDEATLDWQFMPRTKRPHAEEVTSNAIYTGSAITQMAPCQFGAAAKRFLLFSNVCGGFGGLIPYGTDADGLSEMFCKLLETAMREEFHYVCDPNVELAQGDHEEGKNTSFDVDASNWNLTLRGHVAYRSLFEPVRNTVDGDLLLHFRKLSSTQQERVRAKLNVHLGRPLTCQDILVRLEKLTSGIVYVS